ncbi:MAG: hypothetical protein AAF726_05840 [Planctomycetota bacterium]
MTRSFPTTLAAAMLVGAVASSRPALAQLVLGSTISPTGNRWPNFQVNLFSLLQPFDEVWTDSDVHGLAYDESTQTVYLLDRGRLFRTSRDELGPPANIADPVADLGLLDADGLAWNAGTLYVSTARRIYRVFLPSGIVSQLVDLSNGPAGAGLAGLAPGRTPDILYAVNNDATYVDSFGTSGTGLVEIDLSTSPPTHSLIAPYPGVMTSSEGLAADPFGRLYLFRANGFQSRVYDLDEGAYVGFAPNPLTIPSTRGGITWVLGQPGVLGTPFCDATANSTGEPGDIFAGGRATIAPPGVTLIASSLPPQALTLFLTSRTQGPPSSPGVSSGILCLAGSGIGRFLEPGQVQPADADGSAEIQFPLTSLPTPTGFVSAIPGETWSFQAWHRDVGGTSNFTSGVAVTVR